MVEKRELKLHSWTLGEIEKTPYIKLIRTNIFSQSTWLTQGETHCYKTSSRLREQQDIRKYWIFILTKKNPNGCFRLVQISSHRDSCFSCHNLKDWQKTFCIRFIISLLRAVLHFPLKYLSVAAIRDRTLSQTETGLIHGDNPSIHSSLHIELSIQLQLP